MSKPYENPRLYYSDRIKYGTDRHREYFPLTPPNSRSPRKRIHTPQSGSPRQVGVEGYLHTATIDIAFGASKGGHIAYAAVVKSIQGQCEVAALSLDEPNRAVFNAVQHSLGMVGSSLHEITVAFNISHLVKNANSSHIRKAAGKTTLEIGQIWEAIQPFHQHRMSFPMLRTTRRTMKRAERVLADLLRRVDEQT